MGEKRISHFRTLTSYLRLEDKLKLK